MGFMILERFANLSYQVRITNETNIPQVTIQTVNHSVSGFYDLTFNVDYPKFFKIGSNYIPKVTSKSTLINYYGPARTFSTYDFADVIDDSTFTTNFEKELETDLDQYYQLAENFKDKIVLIGLTSVEFHDTHHTPFFSQNNQLMPGVEIHANFIINQDNAKADDVIKLIKLIRETVYKKYSITLELEITTLGFPKGTFSV